MKFKVFCAYTFLSICLINNNCFNDIQSYSFCNNTQNNFNQLIENIQKDDPYNISEIKNYLAPSYFALAIQELLPGFVEYVKTMDCFGEYLSELNYSKMKDLITYSSKYFPDFGDEENCLEEGNNNNAFILFVIKYDIHNIKNYTGKFRLLPFISNGFSFYGLCIKNTENCTTNLIKTMNDSLNKFKGMGLSLNGIDSYNISVFLNNSDKKVNFFDLGYMMVVYIIYWTYVGFKIIIWLIGSTFFREKENKSSEKEDDSSSSEEEEEEEENEENESNTKENKENNNGLIEKNNNEKKLSKKELYPRFYTLYQFCSFFTSFKILFKKKDNKYYNEKDLYFIFFFRFIGLISKVLVYNFKFMIRNPSKEIDNMGIFHEKNLLIINLIKFASFGDIIIIITESILVSYKFMSFLRKYTLNEEPSFKLFLNFFLHIIPCFISVVIYFIAFYFANDIVIWIITFIFKQDYSMVVQHLKENLVDCNFCVNNAKSLIPFYLHYINFTNQLHSDDSCFQFMLIMINLFYCYCIFIFLIFVSFKTKNKIFDIVISLLFLINFFLPHNISCQSYLKDHNYFNISLLFGESCSTTYTHLFINYYFFGILIGFSLFYNNDITNENPFQNSDNYKPFFYLKDINGAIFKSPNWLHALIITITVSIQALLSISFQIYNGFNLQPNNLQELSEFDDFLYLNEKKIFALAFGILITYLYNFKSESKLKNFGNNIIIITANRLGYAFYAIIESLINHCIITFRFVYSISAPTIIFSTFGFITFIIFINLLAYPHNEFPLKMLTKKLLKISKNN